MPPTCCLRKTMVTLLDGEEYAFRALPLTEETVDFLRLMVGDSIDGGNAVMLRQAEMLVKAVRKSLSYDQPKELVDQIMDMGLVPSPASQGDDHQAVLGKVLEALGLA
jgi:hypothetical protein